MTISYVHIPFHGMEEVNGSTPLCSTTALLRLTADFIKYHKTQIGALLAKTAIASARPLFNNN